MVKYGAWLDSELSHRIRPFWQQNAPTRPQYSPGSRVAGGGDFARQAGSVLGRWRTNKVEKSCLDFERGFSY